MITAKLQPKTIEAIIEREKQRGRASVRERLKERKKREGERNIIVAASVGVTCHTYRYNQLDLSNPRKRPLTLRGNGVRSANKGIEQIK